ncbi:transcription antitermination factor NusB [Leptolyngbya sp. PCC 6406]|uniref:transcription antitermination factor NusB n=1 Tax=Leptolyngbya sp. PCC 6406 TaxID=1173264 RepID=UPI0002ABBAC1|nr:transcription antitermination factor NusB [Leptolyngbya sp. PCC 6406]
MQARRIARELALLSMGQLPTKPEKLSAQDLEGLLAAAVRSLVGEVQDALEKASGDLQRSQEQLLESETRTTQLAGARAMVQDAIAGTQQAINNLGGSLQIPELVQGSNQKAVRSYAVEVLSVAALHRQAVDAELDQVMVAWQVKRLAQIDRDLLRLAVVEMQFLGVPDRVAINEAVELAKRYSDEDGYRFINGVLRRWLEQFRNQLPQEDGPKTAAPTDPQSSLV